MACFLAIALPADARVIVQPISVTTLGGPDPFATNINRLIDQSGLAMNYESGTTDFDTFTQTVTASFTSVSVELGGAQQPPVNFDFDLGQVLPVEAIAIWNNSGSASLIEFDLLAALNPEFSGAEVLGNFTIPNGSNPTPANVIFFEPTDTRYIRIDVVRNNGFSTATRMNEVAFGVVPEPSPLALLCTALAGLALGLPFRR